MERNKDGGILRRRKKAGKYWRREKEKLERKVEDAKRWKRRDETERLENGDRGWLERLGEVEEEKDE